MQLRFLRSFFVDQRNFFVSNRSFVVRDQNLFVDQQGNSAHPEEIMVQELNFLNEWIPEQMGPGTLFVLENAGDMGENEDPYWAVLACPECGTLGLITRKQIAGLVSVICGSECCPTQFFIRDNDIVARPPS
jgi:hypothetical protein